MAKMPPSDDEESVVTKYMREMMLSRPNTPNVESKEISEVEGVIAAFAVLENEKKGKGEEADVSTSSRPTEPNSVLSSDPSQPSRDLDELQNFVDLDFILDSRLGDTAAEGGGPVSPPNPEGAASMSTLRQPDVGQMQPFNWAIPRPDHQVAGAHSLFGMNGGPGGPLNQPPPQDEHMNLEIQGNLPEASSTCTVQTQWRLKFTPASSAPTLQQALLSRRPLPPPMVQEPLVGAMAAGPSPRVYRCQYHGCYKMYKKYGFYKKHLKKHTDPRSRGKRSRRRANALLETVCRKTRQLGAVSNCPNCPICHGSFSPADPYIVRIHVRCLSAIGTDGLDSENETQMDGSE